MSSRMEDARIHGQCVLADGKIGEMECAVARGFGAAGESRLGIGDLDFRASDQGGGRACDPSFQRSGRVLRVSNRAQASEEQQNRSWILVSHGPVGVLSDIRPQCAHWQ